MADQGRSAPQEKQGEQRSPEATKRTRRQFLKYTGVATGAAALGPTLFKQLGLASTSAAQYSPVTLTQTELSTLQAVMSRLIPADEELGGAPEARAHVYVDRSLNNSYAHQLPLYQDGLAGLNQTAQANGADSFADLSPDMQDELLSRLENGELDGQIENGSDFFGVVRQHTLEGTFCDPIYGGNHDFIGWDLLGYYGLMYVYTESQQEVGTDVEPAHQSIEQFGGEPVL